MITIKHINHSYPDGDSYKQILKDVDFKFEEGKLYTIEGPSGSGKTTLLSIIAGLDKPDSGEVKFLDDNIMDIGLNNYRRKFASIVFQSYNLIEYMTSIENVNSAIEIASAKSNYSLAKATLISMGFDDAKNNRLVNKLSGGEQQRVAIARCLATNSKVVLADEPTGNLDNKTEEQILNIFRDLAHKEKKCVIIVTHSKKVSSIADVKLKLKNKKLVS